MSDLARDYLERIRADRDRGEDDALTASMAQYGLAPSGAIADPTLAASKIAQTTPAAPTEGKGSMAGDVFAGVGQSAADVNHVLANTAGLVDRAAGKISEWTGLPRTDAFQYVQKRLKEGAAIAMPDLEDLKSRDAFSSHLARAIGAAPLSISEYVVGGKLLRSSIASMAVIDAIRESDKGVWETVKGGLHGLVFGAGLAGISKLPVGRATKAGLTGAGFGGATALAGGGPKEITAQTLVGFGLGAIGGGKKPEAKPTEKPPGGPPGAPVEVKPTETKPAEAKPKTPEELAAAQLLEQYTEASRIEAEGFLQEIGDTHALSRTDRGRTLLRQKIAAEDAGLPTEAIERDIRFETDLYNRTLVEEGLIKRAKPLETRESYERFWQEALAREEYLRQAPPGAEGLKAELTAADRVIPEPRTEAEKYQQFWERELTQEERVRQGPEGARLLQEELASEARRRSAAELEDLVRSGQLSADFADILARKRAEPTGAAPVETKPAEAPPAVDSLPEKPAGKTSIPETSPETSALEKNPSLKAAAETIVTEITDETPYRKLPPEERATFRKGVDEYLQNVREAYLRRRLADREIGLDLTSLRAQIAELEAIKGEGVSGKPGAESRANDPVARRAAEKIAAILPETWAQMPYAEKLALVRQAKLETKLTASKAASLIESEKGEINSAILYPIARALSGALVGAFQGDTLEERVKNAFLYGLGFAVAPIVARRAIAVLRRDNPAAIRAIEHIDQGRSPSIDEAVRVPLAALKDKKITQEARKRFDDFMMQHEEGPVPEGRSVANGINFDHINTTADVKYTVQKIAKTFEDKIAAAREIDPKTGEGVSHEETKARARLLRELGYDENMLLEWPDGRPMTTAELYAFREIRHEATLQLHDMAVEYKKNPTTEGQDAMTRQLEKVGRIYELVGGDITEGARKTESMRIDVVDGEVQFAKEVGGKLLEAKKTGVEFDRLVDMIDQLDPKKTAEFARKLHEPNAADGVLRLWYGIGLLSNPGTLVANASAAFNVGWQIPKRLVAAGLTDLQGKRGDPNYVQWSEPVAQIFALRTAYKDAFEIAAKAFLTGERQFGTTWKFGGGEHHPGQRQFIRFGMHSDALTENFGVKPSSYLATALDYLGMASDLFPRMMSGTDEFLKVFSQRMELGARAARDGRLEATNTKEFAEGMAKLIKEDRLTPQEIEAAKDVAMYDTLNSEQGPLLKMMDVGRERLRDVPYLGPAYYMLSKGIAPFINIPVNVTKWAIHNGPLAGLSARFYDRLGKGGADAQLAMAEVTLGSMYLTAAAFAAYEGLITGTLPTTPDGRKMAEAEGEQSDSINISGGSVQFSRIDPLGMMTGWAADVVKIAGHVNDSELIPLVGAMALAITRPLGEKTYVRSLTQLAKALLSGDTREIAKYLKSQASIANPGIFRAIRQQMDPYRRQVDSMLDAVKNQTPFFSTDMPPDSDAFGRPILTGRAIGPDLVRVFGLMNPFNYREKENNPVIQEILKNEIQISSPSEFIFGREDNPYDLKPADSRTGIELKGWNYYYYKKLAGDDALERLGELIQSETYQNATGGPDGKRALLIQAVVTASRERARLRLLDEFPQLEDQRRQKIEQRRMAIQG